MCFLVSQYCLKPECGLVASWCEFCPNSLYLHTPGNGQTVFWNKGAFCDDCDPKKNTGNDNAHLMRGFDICAWKGFRTYHLRSGYQGIWRCCRCHSKSTGIREEVTGPILCGYQKLPRSGTSTETNFCRHTICGKCELGKRSSHWGLAFVTKANSIAVPDKSGMELLNWLGTVEYNLQLMREKEAAGRSQPELKIESHLDPEGKMVDDRRRTRKERDHRRDGPSSNSTEQPAYGGSREDTRSAYESNTSNRPSTRSREDRQRGRDAPPQQFTDPNTKGPIYGQDIATNSTTYPSAGMGNVGGPSNNGNEDTRDRGGSGHHRAEIPPKKSSTLSRGIGKLFGKEES
ncbi:hypothetical protein V8F33_009567 [Rhypophila sp. PSN 637]